SYVPPVTPRRAVIFMSFFFSSRRRHTRSKRDWSSDVCSSDLELGLLAADGVDAELFPDRLVQGDRRSGELAVLLERVGGLAGERSEERRVGKECRARWAA